MEILSRAFRRLMFHFFDVRTHPAVEISGRENLSHCANAKSPPYAVDEPLRGLPSRLFTPPRSAEPAGMIGTC